MIIAIDAGGHVVLNGAADFKGFKVTTANTDSTFLTKALAAAGRYDGSHAWISQSWLIDQGKAHGTAWREGFDKMAAFSRRAGSRTARSARMWRRFDRRTRHKVRRHCRA